MQRQRKLNTKFLVILTAVIVGGLLVLVVGGRYMFRGTAEKHIQMAELYAREGRLAEAADEYRSAINLDGRNPEVYLKLGDLMRLLTRTDPMLVDKDKAEWNRALEVDPTYQAAMERLLDAYLEDAQLFPVAVTFERVRDIASRMLALDPGDMRAKAALHSAWLHSALAGVEAPAQQVDESLRELSAIQELDPENLDVPFTIARALIWRANQYSSQQRSYAELINAADKAMEQSVAANPENARAVLRRGQIELEISNFYARDPALRRTFRTRGAASVALAQELVNKVEETSEETVELSPDEQQRQERQRRAEFYEVNMLAAMLAHQDQKLVEAETIYRQLLAQQPDDRAVRIALAQLLVSDPTKRDDAIALLEEEITEEQTMGSRVRLRRDMELRTQMVLAGLRIDALAAAKSDEEKAELLKRIDGHLTQIHNRQGESPQYLRLKGRLHQAQAQFVDAIQTYNRASIMLAQLGQGTDDDMMYQLARCYIAAQQTGEARNILEDLVRKHEIFTPARILLARVLIAEGSHERAAPHLRFLEENEPNDPQVTALLLASAASQQQSVEKRTDLLKRLPEGSREEKLVKARAALESAQPEEALRIAADLLASTPGDDEAAQISIQAMLRQDRNQDARAFVDEALAANPESSALKIMKAQLGGDGEQLIEVLAQNLEQIKDEFTRELAKARLAEARGDKDAALGHLKAAESSKPESAEVWDQLFQYYARHQQWDLLQPYLQKLEAANQDKAGGLLYRFRLAMAMNETDRAVEIAQQLTNRLPEFAQSWLALAQGYQAARKFEEARDAYLRVLEKTPMSLDAYRGLVDVCYMMRQYDNAGRYIADARKRMPNNAMLKNMEIEHELNFGRAESVIGQIEQQAAQQADRPQSWVMLGRAYERVLQRRASRGDEEVKKWATKLRDHYTTAHQRWPENSDFAGRLAEAHVMLNEREQAEGVLRQHVEQTSGNADAVMMLADYYLRAGEVAHSEMTVRQAIAKAPQQTDLYIRLASLQFNVGRPDDAIKTLDGAPNQDEVLMSKLELMLNSGKIAESKAMIQKALQTRGEDFGLVNAQAYIALQENDLKAARTFADKSLSLKPNNPIALHQRALAKLREDTPDVGGAIIDLKLAIQQAPANVELRLTASEAYLKRRDRESAIRELELAAAASPRNRTVWTRLMDMYLDSQPPRLDQARQLVEQVRAAGAGDLDLTIRSARIAAARRDSGNAIIEMRKAIQMTNGDANLIRDYLMMLVELDQYDHVLKESEQLLGQLPDVWWVRHVRGIARTRLGARDEGVAEWDRALALADRGNDTNASLMIVQGMARDLGLAQVMPMVLERAKQEPRWVMFAAWLYQNERDWRNAVVMADQALAGLDKMSKDEQTRALQVAGAIYLSAQPPLAQKAVEAYTQVLQRDPEDLATLNNMACLYIDQVSPPDPAKALQFSQRAYDLMRKRGLTEPLVMDTHGWVLTNAGRLQEGIVLLQEVVQRKPFLEARYHLAEAYLKGDYGDAAVRQLNEVNQILAESAARKQPVDEVLKAKVAQAMARAVEMAREQGGGNGESR